MLNVVQVCNVGSIVGGTAACAWTVTGSLPDCDHTVAFLARLSDETRRAFAHCRLLEWSRVEADAVAEAGAEIVLLHNTHPRHVAGRLPVPTVQYRHSAARAARADVTVYCSRWLAERCGGDPKSVLHQGVPKPPKPDTALPGGRRGFRRHPVIGRICTPTARKWPSEIVGFYARLATGFPDVEWEFVGCPVGLQSALEGACGGRAVFLKAGWSARSRLRHWDALLYHNPHVAESFGRTVAEAMRAGCIPIVDDCGGFREQIAEGCGFLCGDLNAFARAVETIGDEAVRWRMSHRCQAHAEERFSLARFRSELLCWFRRAADGRARCLE